MTYNPQTGEYEYDETDGTAQEQYDLGKKTTKMREEWAERQKNPPNKASVLLSSLKGQAKGKYGKIAVIIFILLSGLYFGWKLLGGIF